MIKSRVEVLFVFGWLLFHVNISAQSKLIDQYEIIQYTIDDGLPSNECHDVVQDSVGYIWIATDRGLVRFDGYGFKTYGHKEGLMNISCMALQIDHNQDIWIKTYGHEMYIYKFLEDTIVPYKGNSVLKQFEDISIFNNFLVTPKNDFYANLNGLGLLKLDKNFNKEITRNECHSIMQVPFRKESRYFLTSPKEVGKCFQGVVLYNGTNFKLDNFSYNGEIVNAAFNPNRFLMNPQALSSLDNSNLIFYYYGYRYFFENDTLVKVKESEGFQKILEFSDSTYYACQLNSIGVKKYSSYEALKNNIYSTLLPNISATSGVETSRGNLFFTSLSKGLFFLKKRSHIQDSFIQDISATKVQVINDSIFYCIESTNKIYSINYRNAKKELIADEGYFYDFYIDKEKQLYLTFPFGYSADTGSDTKFRLTKKLDDESFGGKRIIQCDSLFWLIGSKGFMSYDLKNHKSGYKSFTNSDIFKIESLIPFDDNTLLLGTNAGLYRYDYSKKIPLVHLHPLFNQRINDIIGFGELIFIGTMGGGLVVWDGQSYFDIIDAQDGLVSNNIERLLIFDGDIYICTYNGLTVLEYNGFQKFNLVNYTTNNGLPSNQVFDVDFYDQTLFVATGNGVVLISEEPSSKSPMKTIIEEVMVNGENVDLPNIKDLSHNQNTIRFNFKSLDLTRGNEILYQYTIDGQEWHSSYVPNVSFISLKPGKYKFQVKSDNENGVWGKPTKVEFEIHPAWWKSRGFTVFMGILFLSLIYWVVNRRIKFIKEKSRINSEIKSLEKAALQAQMNPHFIFNCLNSIQSFVMNNEKYQAMDYLSKFAQLIRGNLQSSRESKVPLLDEISMLQNYLLLEQLRLNHKFDFEITCTPDINQIETLIPVMLVEPFVENAVIHGMKHLSQDGIIRIEFSLYNEFLRVVIFDNGTFIKNKTKDSHQSLGTEITKKRLAYINEIPQEQVQINTQILSNGTQVNMLIKL